MTTTTTVSKKFAHLPNGIIRHIVSYTGATYKKRNGKYMGQIPQDDPRYAILNTKPKSYMNYASYSDHLPYSYATNYVEFNRNMFFCVAISTYPKKGREVIGYYHIIQNLYTGERRRYAHEIDYLI